MLRLPKITGLIDRRVLINYRIDIKALSNYLPAPFEPVEVQGYGVAGICLIRLKHIRPSGFPSFVGINSENGAHRIAVRWTENGDYKEGVYIPRRDTDSRINNLTGGRIFSGEHFLSQFTVKEQGPRYEVKFKHSDGTYLEIDAQETEQFSAESIFQNKEEASQFFEKGSTGYSPNKTKGFDCLELKINHWDVSPLITHRVKSSFFENTDFFPPGSVHFDNALLMKNIPHEWEMGDWMLAANINI